MKLNDDRLVYAVLFALLFASLSWIIPAGYYTMAPQDRMLSVDEVAVDATDEDQHTLNVSYESRGDYVIEAQILLFQQKEDEKVDVAQQRWSIEGFIEPGDHETSLNLDIEKPLTSGMYFYEVRIKFRPGYNVERTEVYKTTPFSIENNSTESSAMNASESVAVSV